MTQSSEQEKFMRRKAGRTAAQENAARFESFVAEREQLNDWDDYVHPKRHRLLRERTAEACGFSRSVLLQNHTVVGRLRRLEDDLRKRKILTRNSEETSRPSAGTEVNRDSWLISLDQQLCILEGSIRELHGRIAETYLLVDELVS
jgi:hypothetical protein